MPAVAVLVAGCWQGVGPFIGEPHAEGEENSRVSGQRIGRALSWVFLCAV